MKKVTSWAAIIAVPTAITGFYGQNLPYPGFGHVRGFWASTIVIVVLVLPCSTSSSGSTTGSDEPVEVGPQIVPGAGSSMQRMLPSLSLNQAALPIPGA